MEDDAVDRVTAPTDEPASAADRKWYRRPTSALRVGTAVGLTMVAMLCGLAGWLAHQAAQSRNSQQQRELFLSAGRQGALNLTTIDWRRADADVQRILDSATGEFYDDFSKRSQPFVELVKKLRSKSVGTIQEAGLESVSADQAQVVVAVTVKTSSGDAPEQDPRGWRMRISVKATGGEGKISNVAFVP
jgi:Mce-associated membrane protein